MIRLIYEEELLKLNYILKVFVYQKKRKIARWFLEQPVAKLPFYFYIQEAFFFFNTTFKSSKYSSLVRFATDNVRKERRKRDSFK